jgi:hypothetical protein
MLRRTQCSRRCGWFRDWNDSELWRGQLIDHPGYGSISCGALADLDIERHDCEAHAAARGRLRYRQAAREAAQQLAA